ncbi:H-2 class I histocompatibility antigen, Q9 alpha chain-like [Onychostoma macrolepis]|uniref:H-2 class I histocompatibility antigen, Q9 alpha chain-like n=1 Tax=Onychostoma macrolepis TaxID=369639 RepID=UPI00272D8FCE|nr:H-2 class I histocompatibility antigen, Q9 alpha chain-like [Onychostoma macrolepis]
MQSVLALLLIGIQLVYAGKHSLQYFYTATSGLPNFPQFVTVGIVDGQPFTYYDSNIRRETPRQEWMAKSEGEEYWEGETQKTIGTEQSFVNNINVAKDRFNQTGGVHTFQFMYGCELDGDGTKRGYWQIGYDGEDFISLDKSTRTFTAANPQAMTTKVKWDSTGALANSQSNYLENICIEWLQKYVGYGKSTLERKVSPQVSLLQKSPSSSVSCHATGFYPSGVTISWQREGQEHDEDVDLGELIINEDGTFQRVSTLNVKPEEWKKNEYKCVVEHQGKTIREILTEDKIKTNHASVPIGIIVGVVAVVLLLVIIAVAGFMVYQKKKGFKPVASDDGSNSSTHSNQNHKDETR